MILVTGGAGFIGSHLCKSLLDDHHDVILVDNFDDFYNPEIKERNILSFQNDPKFKLHRLDIRDYQRMEEIFQKYSISGVFHLAARAGVRPSLVNPLLYQDVNVRGTANLLELSAKYKVKKFIFASSSSVYGNNKKVPFSESDNVDFPISPYAATKKMGEVLCYTYHHLYGFDVTCLRFFTVYGPCQRPEMAIQLFANMIDQGEPIKMFGDGNTRRDYTYVDDIIEGVRKAYLHCKGYHIYNLGESDTISLKNLISLIEFNLDKKANIISMPMQAGDVNQTFADISQARREIGYCPKTKIEQGIPKFIEWFKQSKGHCFRKAS